MVGEPVAYVQGFPAQRLQGRLTSVNYLPDHQGLGVKSKAGANRYRLPGELPLFKPTFALAMSLACCSCNAISNSSQFAIRCSGSQSVKINADGAPSITNQGARTYVVDPERKILYRADPYMVANLCELNGRCDVEVTPERVTAIMTKTFGAGDNRNRTESRFVLDRLKGELRTTDIMTVYLDDEPGDPITTEGTFTCATVAVPDFRVPES